MTGGAGPLGAADFALRLDRLGPFEGAPALAVGVSGGADSLALTLLADAWTRASGGSLLALTVDHGLRPTAAAEAAQVGRWLQDRGIRHAVLRWDGAKPATGLQAAARAARRRLLAERCRAEGILHLLLAHHRDDQAETLLLREGRGSGPEGLAAMAAIREEADLRLLRPLLDVPKARLEATCRALGQVWVEDPSNRDPRFARSALRAAGLDAEAPWRRAAAAGRARAGQDAVAAEALAAMAVVHPEGWIELDDRALDGADAPRLLARCIAAVGGGRWPPAHDAVRRLLDRLGQGRATLGGCDISRAPGALRILRETGRMAPPAPIEPGTSGIWDGRFAVRLGGGLPQVPCGLAVGALGAEGWRQLRQRQPGLDRCLLPGAVRRSLPALWQGRMVLSVPHLSPVGPGGDALPFQAVFSPARPVAAAAFAVVSTPGAII